MNFRFCTLLAGMLAILLHSGAQTPQAPVISGPMLGHTELRTASLWMELQPGYSGLAVINNNGRYDTAIRTTNPSFFQQIERYTFTGLEPGKTYRYRLNVSSSRNSKVIHSATGTFTTLPLWQWRTPPPDFSFLAGSCTYFNEPVVDRPGKPYGGDSSIFRSMSAEKADFMLWLGDNWYTREVDYYSEAGLNRRAQLTRSMPILQDFWKAMPHYAIWDDHDYGPNDADISYILKNESRQVFTNYWSNPSYGDGREGIYTKITWNDVELFLLDSRTFRTNDNMPDTIEGRSTGKQMFGPKQLNWLKNALLQSNGNGNIRFRIIVNGSQMLNPGSPFDRFSDFKEEYRELTSFLSAARVKGVLFFSGDRHHSEIIKVDRPGTYPLYDITSSPLTSGTHSFGGIEKNNPYRVLGLDKIQNYSRFTIQGEGAGREMKIEYKDISGKVAATYTIRAEDLK